MNTPVSHNEIYDPRVADRAAQLLIKIHAFTFRFDPPYTYTSGIKSPIYIDNRLIMSYVNIRNIFIDYYLEVLQNKIGFSNIDWISATATTAIPMGAWMADRLKLPLVFVRPTTKLAGQGKKTYGKMNKMEGFLKKGSMVLVVEDHISSATSAVDNAECIRANGGIVKYCISSSTYQTKASRELLREHNLQLFTLTSGRLIAQSAYKHGQITKKQKEIVDLWFDDPPSWGKKMGFE